jgi:hypothetical protein
MARRKTDQIERRVFGGFDRPESNYFKMPNTWTDITAEIDSIAELKVVEYILRHTWGYQEYDVKKHITIDEFMRGRRRQDGGRMDKGTGLSERAVYDGLRKAVANGLIEEVIDDSDRGRIKKSYSLKMRENSDADEEVQSLQSGVQSLQSGVQSLHPPLQELHPDLQSLQARGATNAPRTGKDTLERNVDISNFEGSHDQLDRDDRTDSVRGETRTVTSNDRLMPLGEILQLRSTGGRGDAADQAPTQPAAKPRPPRQGKEAGDGEERERLRPFLEDFARELGDEAPLASTITRTLNAFTAANVPPERWSDLLYQARGLTQEHTAQIRKVAGDGGSGMRRKNKMPYFLATLEQLVGLRPAPARSRAVRRPSTAADHT